MQQVYRVDRRIALMGALALAGICVIGALLMLVVSTTDDAALFLLFAVLSAVFGPIAAGVGLTMDGTGLTLHRYFGRSRRVGWNEILAVQRRPHGIVVTAADSRRFLAPDRITYDMVALLHRVHGSMISLDELAQEMRRWHERYHATPGLRPGERTPARPLAAVVPATLVGMVLVPGAMLFAGSVGTFGGLYDLRIACSCRSQPSVAALASAASPSDTFRSGHVRARTFTGG